MRELPQARIDALIAPEQDTDQTSEPAHVKSAIGPQCDASTSAKRASNELPQHDLFESIQISKPTTKQKLEGSMIEPCSGNETISTPESDYEKHRRSPSYNHEGRSSAQHMSGKEGMRPVTCRHNQDFELLRTTTRSPPVTIETLQELDLRWIQNNVNLRVDIHYDHDLHFMPVSGRRGEEKRIEARKYWDCLEIELPIYQHHECQICRSQLPAITSFTPRLPGLFEELRKLLFVLVPEREREEVDQALDVDLLMQQIRQNALDIVRLSRWLSNLLTTHCAPVRDEHAEEMARKISEGARQGDIVALVAGLEKLFSFCEAMKLDVANHQIRTFRTPLIEDGIPFQRDYFSTRIQNGKFDTGPSREWFFSAGQRLLGKDEHDVFGCEVLTAGLVELCVFSDLEIPKTLKHDTTRLRQMQEEVQDIVHLRMCTITFDQCVLELFGPEFQPSGMHQALKTRIMDLTDGEADADEPTTDLWQTNVESVGGEIARALSSVARTAGRMLPATVQEAICLNLTRRFSDKKHLEKMLTRLIEDLQLQTAGHITVFRKMSALRISEVQKQYQLDRQSRATTRLMPDFEDISRRLAHISVIHWQVWGDLAYRADGGSIAYGVPLDSGDGTEMESSGHLQDLGTSRDTPGDYNMG